MQFAIIHPGSTSITPEEFSLKDIESIISELEQQRSAIDRAISALREITGTRVSGSATASQRKEHAPSKKRAISPAGRRKLAVAMRRRWAAKRLAERKTAPVKKSGSGRNGSTAKNPATKKRHLSPEGRRRIIEATKRRWAAKRAAEQDSGTAQKTASSRKKVALKTTTA